MKLDDAKNRLVARTELDDIEDHHFILSDEDMKALHTAIDLINRIQNLQKESHETYDAIIRTASLCENNLESQLSGMSVAAKRFRDLLDHVIMEVEADVDPELLNISVGSL